MGIFKRFACRLQGSSAARSSPASPLSIQDSQQSSLNENSMNQSRIFVPSVDSSLSPAWSPEPSQHVRITMSTSRHSTISNLTNVSTLNETFSTFSAVTDDVTGDVTVVASHEVTEAIQSTVARMLDLSAFSSTSSLSSSSRTESDISASQSDISNVSSTSSSSHHMTNSSDDNDTNFRFSDAIHVVSTPASCIDCLCPPHTAAADLDTDYRQGHMSTSASCSCGFQGHIREPKVERRRRALRRSNAQRCLNDRQIVQKSTRRSSQLNKVRFMDTSMPLNSDERYPETYMVLDLPQRAADQLGSYELALHCRDKLHSSQRYPRSDYAGLFHTQRRLTSSSSRNLAGRQVSSHRPTAYQVNVATSSQTSHIHTKSLAGKRRINRRRTSSEQGVTDDAGSSGFGSDGDNVVAGVFECDIQKVARREVKNRARRLETRRLLDTLKTVSVSMLGDV